MLAEHVDELKSDRIAQRLGNRGDPMGLFAIDGRVRDGLAAALTGGPLHLRSQYEIEGHLFVHPAVIEAMRELGGCIARGK